ncbi:MAG: adenylate/guanylate cyclase domain-containing protein [Gemmataceae bacterium]
MAELMAQGTEAGHFWRKPLPSGKNLAIGRASGEWAISWEKYASVHHAEARWDGEHLHVRRLPGTSNPIFFRGDEAESFPVRIGERFAIGRTTFTLLGESGSGSSESRPILQERSVGPEDLRRLPFRDAPHRLDVLRRLPAVISSAADEGELAIQLVHLLLAGIQRAQVLALVMLNPLEQGSASAEKPGHVGTLHWEGRRFEGATFEPSRRLVYEAVVRQKRTVLHVWAATRTESDETGVDFTQQSDLDWAFCTPVRSESCSGWALYAAGRATTDVAASMVAPLTESELADDLKFAELTADILGALRQVGKLERDQARLSHFFSPTVRKVLTTAEPEATLRPRETEVTVMFCDLRGFSHRVEAEAKNLLGILERVSSALGVMVQQIHDHQGVVADFLGDAALGFWGWPLPDAGMTQKACMAALGIRKYYEAHARQTNDPLFGFRAGIGIATGRAVAGEIGPREQAKVAVFGPVVNLAARLESMTKLLNVPILVDEPTAKILRETMPPQAGRVRRVAKVKPFGLETAVTASEVLPPAQEDGLTDADLANYERALDAFLAGNWEAAFEAIHLVSPRDRGKDILTGYIISHNHMPPPNWNGVIELAQK